MKRSVSKREEDRQRWLDRINAWQNSNQSQKAFCKEHQLGYASFRRWRRILKAEDAKVAVFPGEPVRFLPVNVQEPISSNLMIHIQNDLRIEVVPGFNLQLLQQVLQVLRAS
jgi:hypothetical protein